MTTPTEWADAPEHPGYKSKVIQYGNCTIQIFRPELDAKEQARREAHAKAVAERVLQHYYIRKERKV